MPVVATGPKVAEKTQSVLNLLPAKVVDAFQASGGMGPAMTNAGDGAAHLSAPKDMPAMPIKEKGAVVVNAGFRQSRAGDDDLGFFTRWGCGCRQ